MTRVNISIPDVDHYGYFFICSEKEYQDFKSGKTVYSKIKRDFIKNEGIKAEWIIDYDGFYNLDDIDDDLIVGCSRDEVIEECETFDDKYTTPSGDIMRVFGYVACPVYALVGEDYGYKIDVCTKEEFEKFLHKESVIIPWRIVGDTRKYPKLFLDKENVININGEDYEGEYTDEQWDEYENRFKTNKFALDEVMTYDQFINQRLYCNELSYSFAYKYTSEHGDDMVVFGRYHFDFECTGCHMAHIVTCGEYNN